MNRPTGTLSSSVGAKLLIALTGLALVGFLVLHLAGNLLVLAGPTVFNAYSQGLVSNPLVVPAELGLLLVFLVHIYRTARMWLDSRDARPVGYAEKHWAGHTSRKSIASTTMILTGLITIAFLVLHLKTFKYGAHYTTPEIGVRDLHRLVIEVFSSPVYVVSYVICMALIGLHLRHGVSSAVQSLGLDHPRLTPRIRVGGTVLAVIIGGGFALIPVWIYFLQ